MAELVLKVDPGSGYEDGDVLCAFNRRRIRHCHAQHLTAPKLTGFTKEGLRPSGSLAFRAMELTREFKFERLSKYSIRRTNLRTREVEEFSDKPNAKGEAIDVPMFLERRVKHQRHSIFGLAGKEVWFGGRTYATHAELDQVWQEIEARTPEREANHVLWPAGREEMKLHLFISVDDFDDAEAEAFVAPQLGVDKDGKPIWEYTDDKGKTITIASNTMPDEDNPWQRKIAARREKQVEWEKLAGIDAAKIADIKDKAKTVDLRSELVFEKAKEVKMKPVKITQVIAPVVEVVR